MDAIGWMARIILLILPAYFANSIPVLLGGGAAIDGGRRMWDGQRVFGGGKTVRGLFAGVLAGTAVGAIQGLLLPGGEWDIYGNGAITYVFCGFLLSTGAMAGDLLGSFIKRRQGIAQGKPSLVMDQLLFLYLALSFAYPIAGSLLTLEAVVFLSVLTYFVHVGANILANRLGLKKVPW